MCVVVVVEVVGRKVDRVGGDGFLYVFGDGDFFVLGEWVGDWCVWYVEFVGVFWFEYVGVDVGMWY